MVVILLDHDGHHVTSFARTLKLAGWSVSAFNDVYLPSNGDTIAGRCHLLCGIQLSCTACVEPFVELPPPPPLLPKVLGAYLWEPLNQPEHSVSLGRNDNDFCCQDVRFTAAEPPGDTPFTLGINIKYYLHGHGSDESSLNGSAVISVDGLCPPFDAGTNQNMFQHLFGVKFHFENHTHVRRISPFEFAHCFGFTDNLTHPLSHPACKFSLHAALPGQTSAWIFKQVHAYLVFLRDSNCELFSPNKLAAPAAPIQSFVNSAIDTQLPSRARWIKAYNADPVWVAICKMVMDPAKICKEALKAVHYAYRHALRQSHIVIEDDMLILHKPIRGSASYTPLQIVLVGLRDILFVAFHSNLIGGHLNV